MKRSFLVLGVALFVAGTAGAGWPERPVEGNPNINWWADVQQRNYIGCIYSSIVEKCVAANVPPPAIVESWTVFDGWSNNLVTNGAFVYTNVHPTYRSITTTNQLGPFPYSYTDETGTHSATASIYLTHYFLGRLDGHMNLPGAPSGHDLFYSYVSTNLAENGSFSNYLNNTEGPLGWLTTELPWGGFINDNGGALFQKEQFFLDANIGFIEGLLTNAQGRVTNGIAQFTRRPALTSNWLIAESHFTGAWLFVDVSVFDTRYYETSFYPIVHYETVNSEGVPSLTLTITGQVLNVEDQTKSGDTETVAVSSTNTSLTKYWFSISSMTWSGNGRATGDYAAIYWPVEVVKYGARPYKLYAVDLDERMKLLDSLVWVYASEAGGAWNLEHERYKWLAVTVDNNWHGDSLFVTTWTNAQRRCELDFGPSGHPPGDHHDVDVYTWGQHVGGGNYKGRATATTNHMYLSNNIPATMAHQIDFYLAVSNALETAIDPALNVFDTFGRDYPRFVWGLAYTTPVETNTLPVSEGYGQLSFPSEWVSEPIDETKLRGYAIQQSEVLIRFNVPGGFVYQKGL